jgi:parvulin-like peptidyl-prolyl isomerase
MTWQRLVGAAAVIVGTAAPGCESGPLLRAAAPEGPAVRLQKAEGEGLPPPPGGDLPAAPGEVIAAIRATVNGVPILDSEIREAAIGPLEALYRLPESERAREEQKVMDNVLDALIERELLVQDALSKIKRSGKKDALDEVKKAADKEFQRWLRTAKASFKSDEEFKRFLLSRRTSLEGQKRMRERNFIAEEYLRSVVMHIVDRATGHQELLEYYKKHPEEFTRVDNVQWQDIFVLASNPRYGGDREAARRAAQGLADRARAGEDFVKLCQEYDDGTASAKSAAGDGSRRGEIRPAEAEAVLFQMSDGQVGPVLELRDGFHVIRLVKREHAGLMPFDEKVQTTVKDKLRNEVYLRERKRFLDELWKDAQVQRWPATAGR